MPVKLPKSSYEWAIRHLNKEGDTDLFPNLIEVDAIKYSRALILDDLRNLDINNYQWKGGRRFVVPKEPLAFRVATQLNPMDSLILAALMKKYGELIEKQRIHIHKNRVFSNRFDPTPDGSFYKTESAWTAFWQASINNLSRNNCSWVATADVTDYYNQIYHHVLENQLSEADIPKPVVNIISKFLSTLTDGVSRGIPVGPHSVHLLAECAFNTTDRSLETKGYDFCRYFDDIHFFCKTKDEAYIALFDFAEVLDKQQRLTMQKQKTTVMAAEDFHRLAKSMLVNQPMNDKELRILNLIAKYSANDPYRKISLSNLKPTELEVASQEILEQLLQLYISAVPPNFPRIAWLLRRLAQIGVPGALEFVLKNIKNLTSVLGDVASYIMRASPNYTGDISCLGKYIVDALDQPIIQHSEYIKIILIKACLKVSRHTRVIDSLLPLKSEKLDTQLASIALSTRK